MNRSPRHASGGMALLVAVLFVAVATLVLGTLCIRVVLQDKQVSQYARFNECLQGVESALAQSQTSLESGGNGYVGITTWTPPVGDPAAVPAFDDSGVSPVQLPTMPSVSYMAITQDWSNDGLDNTGDGAVDGPEELGFFTIYGFARNRQMQRGVETVVQGVDVNVWRNAIFGGSGQSGGLINGNVSVHGSVHLLGNNLPAGATAVAAIDLSGTSLIHNNYGGIPAGLAARVPPLPTRVFEGETVQTLNAKLRVKRGLVGLSGNSEIGEPQQTGNAFKETMDGTYVSEGWTGNAVNDDGDRGDPTSVFSDNGWDEHYDLGDQVQLPMLDDDWIDPITGATVLNPSTGVNYTHLEYFTTVLSGTAYPGDLLIQANQNFYYNATRPTDPNPANRLPTDDYLLFNATSNVMEINGQITINGNLKITRGGGSDKTIYYTGRAAILVRGDATLNTDLLTVNPNGTITQSFPANNILGIMAENNMSVGELSQLQLMGAFYAQGQLSSEKQTTVMGTFVSDYFNMGTNVPDIYQVPILADNLPIGMVGMYPVLVFNRVYWREIGV